MESKAADIVKSTLDMKIPTPMLFFFAALALGCPRKPEPAPSAAPVAAVPDRATEEACVDKWLTEHKLDSFGGPEGTMYAGGTPLFDERTGKTTDRLEHVYAQQPAAKQACAH
jgi:hypothetical protein